MSHGYINIVGIVVNKKIVNIKIRLQIFKKEIKI